MKKYEKQLHFDPIIAFCINKCEKKILKSFNLKYEKSYIFYRLNPFYFENEKLTFSSDGDFFIKKYE